MRHTLCVRKDYPHPLTPCPPSPRAAAHSRKAWPLLPHRGSFTQSVAPSPASRLTHAKRGLFPPHRGSLTQSVAPSPAPRLIHAKRGPFPRTAAHSRTAWPLLPHRLTHNVSPIEKLFDFSKKFSIEARFTSFSSAQRLTHAKRGLLKTRRGGIQPPRLVVCA